MITKHEYNIAELASSKDIIIVDTVVDRYSCVQFHNDICKFIIFVLYIAPQRPYTDLKRVIDFIDDDESIDFNIKCKRHAI